MVGSWGRSQAPTGPRLCRRPGQRVSLHLEWGAFGLGLSLKQTLGCRWFNVVFHRKERKGKEGRQRALGNVFKAMVQISAVSADSQSHFPPLALNLGTTYLKVELAQ